MPRGLLAKLRDVIEGNPSVRKVADDPALMAELLLLFRMVLADGEVRAPELEMFKRICRDAFDIGGDELDLVMRHLQDFGYEISAAQAMAVFRSLDRERRVTLARHMAEIARADNELNRHETRLLARLLEVLDLRPADMVTGEA